SASFDVEADFARRLLRNGRIHELPNGFEKGADGVVMTFDAFFQFGELASELDVAAKHPAELDEGAHDGDVDLNGAVAVEHGGEHGDSLLREGEREILEMLSAP